VDREDVQTAKMMALQDTRNAVEAADQASAIGFTIVDREDAQTAKMMALQDTRNAVEAVVAAARQEPRVIGTAVVVLAEAGRKLALSSARRRRGATIGCACQCAEHQGLSITWAPRFGRHPRLATRFGPAVLAVESASC